LTMAAARATLTEVLIPDAYQRAEELSRYTLDGCRGSLAEYGLPTYGVVHGFKGSAVIHDRVPTDYREFLSISTAVSHLRFLVQANNGVFLGPWAKTESWTLSVAHTQADSDRIIENMSQLASMVARASDKQSELFLAGAPQ